jgi:MFS family permease
MTLVRPLQKEVFELDQKPKVYQNYIIVSILLLLFGIAIASAQYKVPSIMPGIMNQFKMDANSASWLMSIFTFVGIILAIPTGILAKKFGPKKMLVAAAVIVVVGSLVGAFSGSGALLIASRAIEGVALIFTTICGPLAVQRYVAPEKVGSATGIWALWVCLGSVFGGTLTPSLYAMTGFVGVWVIYAAAAVVFALIVMIFVKEPGKALGESIRDANEAVAQEPTVKVSYAALFKPNILIFLVGWALFNMVLLAMLAFSPTFMQMEGLDATLSGFVSTLPMLLAVISSPLFGALADKTGKLKVLISVAMVVMGPCAFVLLTNTGPLMWVAAVVMGIVGLGAPVMFITCFTTVIGKPELMAIAMGFFMLIQSLGQFLGTAVTPLLLGTNLTGWTITGIVVMILGFAGTVCTLLTRYDSGK